MIVQQKIGFRTSFKAFYVLKIITTKKFDGFFLRIKKTSDKILKKLRY
ncbi:hypothetical protein OUQ_0771 [Helicobacter pylori R055a]|nr:hypothetical protein OUQ_0771 [Helicobacter pylori R055a]